MAFKVFVFPKRNKKELPQQLFDLWSECSLERGHLVSRGLLCNECVGEEARLDVNLDVSEPVLRCDVDFRSLALSAHALGEGDLVMAVAYGNPDGLCVSEVAHGDVVEIYAETYCHAEGIAHTVELENAFLGKDEGCFALCAGSAARLNVNDLAA